MERRNFIKKAGAASVGLSLFPTFIKASALGRDGHVAPSDRISMILVGCGSQGGYDLSSFLQSDEMCIRDRVKVEVGGDFAIQYQALDHEANNPGYPLIALGSNLNLPTANFNLNTLLAPGIKVNLETYLSSRHHNEAWVKGGYLLIDKMPFLPASDKMMEYLTIKAGVMHPNVGDHHFRRSDNGSVLRNTFVGNYILDDYSTNTGVEVMFRNNGWLLMGGVNNGTLNPALATTKGTGEGKEYIERNMVCLLYTS